MFIIMTTPPYKGHMTMSLPTTIICTVLTLHHQSMFHFISIPFKDSSIVIIIISNDISLLLCSITALLGFIPELEGRQVGTRSVN